MRGWLKEGQPACFPLPVFFFPQGFMTGTLQTFARKYQVHAEKELCEHKTTRLKLWNGGTFSRWNVRNVDAFATRLPRSCTVLCGRRRRRIPAVMDIAVASCITLNVLLHSYWGGLWIPP